MKARDLNSFEENVLEEWAAHLRQQGHTASTVERTVKRLKAFARSLGGRGLFQATRADVANFAAARAAAVSRQRGDAADPYRYVRGRGWEKTAHALRSFYRWARVTRGLSWLPGDPTHGMRRLPPGRRRGPLAAAKGRHYENILRAPISSDRDRALIWLLAHGVRPTEVVVLRPEDVEIDEGYVCVRGRGSRPRRVPLTALGVQAVSAWAGRQRISSDPWLFPGRNPTRHASIFLPSQVVHRLARDVFPRRPAVQRVVTAEGFRHIFIARALNRRVSPRFLREVVGLDRLSDLPACLSDRRQNWPHRELERTRRRWREWI